MQWMRCHVMMVYGLLSSFLKSTISSGWMYVTRPRNNVYA